jgi:hypothetical protein
MAELIDPFRRLGRGAHLIASGSADVPLASRAMAEPDSPTETTSSTAGSDPFANVISLVAGPIAAVVRSFDQLRRGADELFKGLENFNATMQNLNATAERVNNLLNDFEEPVRTMIPQLVRTVDLADDLARRIEGPVDQVVPGLVQLADTLSSPVFVTFPNQLAAFVDAMNDLMRRLAPLGQLAESAGGLFGLRIPAISRPAEPASPEGEPERPSHSATHPSKRGAGKQAPAKRSPSGGSESS